MTKHERKQRLDYIKKMLDFLNDERNRKAFEKEYGEQWVEDYIDEMLEEIKQLKS